MTASPAIAHRGIHLDLKGTPPTFSRLMEWLDLFAALRLNVLLVEWEDTFPWSLDPAFQCETAYTVEEVRQFSAKAERLGLEIIPLVQTLGHMETFLRTSDRAALREIPDKLDVLNPLAPGAQELVQALLQDLLQVMPNVQRLHLGGDEAWHLGTHPDTAAFIAEHGADALYLQHMKPLFALLAARKIRPILWHDMMTRWSDEAVAELGRECDLMVWGYHGHPDHIQPEHHFHSRHIQRFADLGVPLWGATAFKGGDGPTEDRPNIENRRENALGWLDIAKRHQLTGLVTTGWSRYNTNTAQCETLEAALDTLALQALMMDQGEWPDLTSTDIPALLSERVNPTEGERFRETLEAADAFAEAHRMAWHNLRALHIPKFTVRHDPRRTLRPDYQSRVPYPPADELREKATRYRATLEGRIPAIWLDRYFSERLDAITALREKLPVA